MGAHFPRSVSRRRALIGIGTGASAASVWGVAPLVTGSSAIEELPRIVGHRGAQGLAPPNTRAGIRAALAADADGVELDIRRTADGEFVLFHDPVLDWDSTGQGWIRNRTWDEIEGTRIDGEPLITLSAALSELVDADVGIYLELKESGYADRVLATAADHDVLDRVTIVAFDEAPLESAREAGVRTGLVGTLPTAGLLEDATACGANLAISHYTPRGLSTFVSGARQRGLEAGLWKLLGTKLTVSDALEADIDILVTNRPDYAREALPAQ